MCNQCLYVNNNSSSKVFIVLYIDDVLVAGVGRTHIIVRFQTGNRRKDRGTENFGGFVYVLDRFPQRELGLWVFMCTINTIPFFPFFPFFRFFPFCRLSIFRLPRRGLPRPIYTARVTTPLPPLHSYHACVYPGYHAKGYHAPSLSPRVITPVRVVHIL